MYLIGYPRNLDMLPVKFGLAVSFDYNKSNGSLLKICVSSFFLKTNIA